MLAAVALVAGMGAAGALYDDADVRAILFSREHADTLGAPLVLLAHQTSIEMLGNGARTTEEHWIWYVSDPSDSACACVREPRVLVDRTMESFGLSHCRIYRGNDTLRVEAGHWQTVEPRGWPSKGADPFQEVVAEMPPLAHGDVIELAYVVKNYWSAGRFPSDWATVPISNPNAPTVERHIKLSHNSTLEGNLSLQHSDAQIIEHLGVQPPLYEVLTGNLPRGPVEPTGLDAPRLLFTSHTGWGAVRRVFERQGGAFLSNGERMFRAIGDSLALAQPSARVRLQDVLDHLTQRVRRVPIALTATTYYPRNAQVCYHLGAADRLEWALLVAALATAAKVHVEVYLARDNLDGFDPALASPAQFDRVLLRALVTEEDRTVVFDPWGGDFAKGQVTSAPLLLPLTGGDADLFELVPGDDYLVPISF
jgi:hypothetical protein